MKEQALVGLGLSMKFAYICISPQYILNGSVLLLWEQQFTFIMHKSVLSASYGTRRCIRTFAKMGVVRL